MKNTLSFFVFLALLIAPVLSTAQEYTGMIVNDIGRPAAFAKVTLENLADKTKTMSVVTDTTGTFSFTISPSGISAKAIPTRLYGNFPNPFNPQTRISYSVDKPSEVVFHIYNVLGQHVRTLNDGYRETGYYTVSWNGLNDNGNPCSAGVYLYRIVAGDRSLSSKMLMILCYRILDIREKDSDFCIRKRRGYSLYPHCHAPGCGNGGCRAANCYR